MSRVGEDDTEAEHGEGLESEEEEAYFAATQIIEYKWPPDNPEAETYMLQEQIIDYLEVRGFSRKYPDLFRRPLEVDERKCLVDLGVVTETQSNLGLVALKSTEVYQLMFEEYPTKFCDYMKIVEQRQFYQLLEAEKETRKNLVQQQALRAKQDRQQLESLEKAASEFNKQLKSDQAKRMKLFHDPSNGKICNQFPRNLFPSEDGPKHLERDLFSETHPISPYPAALLPNQYSDTVLSFDPEELFTMPLSTVLKHPPSPKLHRATSDHPKTTETSGPLNTDSSQSGGFDITNLLSSHPLTAVGTMRTEVLNPPSILLPEVITDCTKQKSVLDKLITKPAQNSNLCSLCFKGSSSNTQGRPEELICCSKCYKWSHPSCIGVTADCAGRMRGYPWECNDCKVCCMCHKLQDDDKVILCDLCDRGYHSFCVGLVDVPSGCWICVKCQ